MSLVCAHAGLFSEMVAVAVLVALEASPLIAVGILAAVDAHLFWVEKHVFPNGHFRHSPGKLFYRIVIPPP